MFEFIRLNLNYIYNKDLKVILPIIKRSIKIKQEIVSKDKYDLGLRKILNFGHTIGHSIESYYGFTKYNHGESIILGIMYESYIGKELGLIDEGYFSEIFTTLKNLVLPIKFSNEE